MPVLSSGSRILFFGGVWLTWLLTCELDGPESQLGEEQPLGML